MSKFKVGDRVRFKDSLIPENLKENREYLVENYPEGFILRGIMNDPCFDFVADTPEGHFVNSRYLELVPDVDLSGLSTEDLEKVAEFVKDLRKPKLEDYKVVWVNKVHDKFDTKVPEEGILGVVAMAGSELKIFCVDNCVWYSGAKVDWTPMEIKKVEV